MGIDATVGVGLLVNGVDVGVGAGVGEAVGTAIGVGVDVGAEGDVGLGDSVIGLGVTSADVGAGEGEGTPVGSLGVRVGSVMFVTVTVGAGTGTVTAGDGDSTGKLCAVGNCVGNMVVEGSGAGGPVVAF